MSPFASNPLIAAADNHTDADYIAFVDTDTLFITVITYELLFDDYGRPRAFGSLGPPAMLFWSAARLRPASARFP